MSLRYPLDPHLATCPLFKIVVSLVLPPNAPLLFTFSHFPFHIFALGEIPAGLVYSFLHSKLCSMLAAFSRVPSSFLLGKSS